MNSKKIADYRIRLAKGFLKESEQNFEHKQWRACVSNSQLSTENSGKAIIAIFKPVEKTHEPVKEISQLIANDLIEPELAEEIENILPLFAKLGLREHFKTDYGDEQNLIVPWDLFDEDDAKKALETARKCFFCSKSFFKHIFFDEEVMECKD